MIELVDRHRPIQRKARKRLAHPLPDADAGHGLEPEHGKSQQHDAGTARTDRRVPAHERIPRSRSIRERLGGFSPRSFAARA